MFKLYKKTRKDEEPLSFDAIGADFGINGERARVIIRRMEAKEKDITKG